MHLTLDPIARGFIEGVFWLLLTQIAMRYVAAKMPDWILFYRGIPVWRWLGMGFLLLGTRMLNWTAGQGAGAFMQQIGSRMWISPKSKAFEIDKDIPVHL